jgi:hypothetical protein
MIALTHHKKRVFLYSHDIKSAEVYSNNTCSHDKVIYYLHVDLIGSKPHIDKSLERRTTQSI